jgi:hypothetical protein
MVTRKTKVEVEIPEDQPQEQVATIRLKKIERATATVEVVGTAPLIVHRFDEKAKAMMLAGMQSKTRTRKPPKDPEAEFERSMYRFPDGGHGFPAVGFKAAMVDSARVFEGVKMTELRACIQVIGEGSEQLVRIESADPRMREDAVRLGGSSADLRYRAEYTDWKAVLTVNFVPSMLSPESVYALVDAAGLGGIGEWRPSKAKTGIYGTFQVV